MAKQQPVPQLRTAGGIRYELTRKRVKNLNIRVREDGTVAVSIPLRTSAEAADRFVAARAAWVQQAQARARRRSLQDATVFFLTADDRLYALDARGAVRFGRGVVGFAAGAAEVQELLRGIADRRSLPSSADELLKVERLRENRSHYVIKCRVRRRGGRVFTRTYFLVKGYEDEDELLRQLGLRRRWDAELEFAESRTPLRLLICVLVFAGFAALCVLSHPAVARLPEGIYFPCLAAAFAALFGAVYFGILLRRGE